MDLILLKDILTEITGTHATNSVSVSEPMGIAVYADSSPAPIKDTVRNGWIWQKTVADASKFNYYFYQDRLNASITINNLKNFYMVVQVMNITTQNSLPFLVLYTNTTDEPSPAFYKSRISYSLDMTAHKIFNGEKVILYHGTKPTYFSNLRKLPLTLEVKEGAGHGDEVIKWLTCHSDSSSPIGTSIVIHNLVWNSGEVYNNLKLV